MSLEFHEGKACDAVIRSIEARVGQVRYNLRWPEKEGSKAPVELACEIGDQLYAFEHTGIEPFEGFVKFAAQHERTHEPIRAALQGSLPPDDYFYLDIPLEALGQLKARDLAQTQAEIVAWAKAIGPSLPAAEVGRVKGAKSFRPTGKQFDVRMSRSAAIKHVPGYFGLINSVNADGQECKRRERIRRACAAKFPKLAEWKRTTGARSVLILEDNDISLSNPQSIYDAYVSVESEFENRPDEVHLVVTITEPTWWVFRFRDNDGDFCSLSEAGLCLTEFEPARLDDLTV
jgi:hypothetical protein